MEELTDSKAQPVDILVVDDTVANLQLLTGMLKEEGFKVRPVNSGKLAIRAARNQRPDLILLDINMPEMGGYEVCEVLKGDPRTANIPIIFISALSETLDKVRAFEAGGVDYVTKPFQFEEVRARVDSHLELSRLQNELHRRNRELEAKNQTLHELKVLGNRLTRLIIEDLRLPLSAIEAYLEMLQMNSMGKLQEEHREDIDKAIAVSHRMKELVDSMVDITRLEEARMPMQISRCDLVELTEEAIAGLGSLGIHRNLTTTFSSDRVMVACDPALTRRIIINLVHNALKYTPRQGFVRVSVEERDDGVRLIVEDNGPGIPEKYKDRIFDKFGLGELQARSRQHSAGLGLAFCKLAVNAQGGEIGRDDAPEGGSIFWFELPPEYPEA